MDKPSLHLYLDDSGTRFHDKKPSFVRSDGMDHFALGGLLIESEKVPEVKALYKVFQQETEITYPLHSHKIRTKKGDFRWLALDKEKAEQFYAGLANLIGAIPGLVVGCCIDRPGYVLRYQEKYQNETWMMSKSAYSIVVERAAKRALSMGRKLLVYVEQTGEKEDDAIRLYHAELYERGMFFDSQRSSCYQPLKSDDFSSTLMKNPSFFTKYNVCGQLADIVLYPIVKGRYDPSYPPYQHLIARRKLIDQHLSEDEVHSMGIKYYCFEHFDATIKSKKAPVSRSPCPPSQTTPDLD